MRIALIHGGDIRVSSAKLNAISFLKDLEMHDDVEVSLYEVVDGKLYKNSIAHEEHKVFPKLDAIVDFTFSHKNRQKHHELAHKLGVKVYFGEETDIDNFRRVLNQINVEIPKHKVLEVSVRNDVNKRMHQLWREVHLPIIIKSKKGYAPSLVTYSFHEALEHVKHILDKNSDVVIDEYDTGRTYSLVSIKNFRGSDIYTSPLIENISAEDKKRFVLASSLKTNEKNEICSVAKKVHGTLDEKLVRLDFTLHNGVPKLVSISTKPDLFEGKSAFEGLKSSGVNFKEIFI